MTWAEFIRFQKLALLVWRPENWSGDVRRAMPFLRALLSVGFQLHVASAYAPRLSLSVRFRVP